MEDFRRMIIKVSDVEGASATIPVSNDHTDGSWLVTDIYEGELFLNLIDNILQTRTDAGIINLNASSSSDADRVVQDVRYDEGVEKGEPLRITGYNVGSGIITVEKADASASAEMPSYGLAMANYSSGATGQMIAVGTLTDVNTSAFSEGDTVYVAVGGGLTNVKPIEPNLIQNVGFVARSNANNGSIEVVAIGRANDVPNLPLGHTFIGTATNPTTIDLTTALDSKVSGTGTTNYVSKWTGANTQGDSLIFDDGTNVGIGTTTPSAGLHVIDAVEPLRFGYSASAYGSIITTSGGDLEFSCTGNEIDFHRNANQLVYLDVNQSGTNHANFRMWNSYNVVNYLTTSGNSYLNGGNVGIGTTAPSEALDVVGKIALNDGGESVFIGENAGFNDDGSTNRNVGIGVSALENNTTGAANTATGVSALKNNIIGSSNSATGRSALESNITGGNNTAHGHSSGRYISDGTTANSVTNNSVYLGKDTKALANNQTNQIVIGYDATGIGSNSVVLGNDSITKTALKGNVGIGTTNPSNKLDVVGSISSTDIRIGSSASGEGIIRVTGTGGNGLAFTTGLLNGSGIGLFVSNTSNNRNVGIGTTAPTEKLEVSGNIKAEGSVQVGDNTDTATSSNVGAMRYTTDGSGSFADMCMEVAPNTYEWVNIVTNTFN